MSRSRRLTGKDGQDLSADRVGQGHQDVIGGLFALGGTGHAVVGSQSARSWSSLPGQF